MNIQLKEFFKRDRQAPGTRGEYKSYMSKPRVYVRMTFPGSSMVDDLVLRRMHSPRKLKPLVIETLKENGIVVNKLKWSRYAGCSCPCSPGFIIEDFGMINSGNPSDGFRNTRFDCWVEYSYE